MFTKCTHIFLVACPRGEGTNSGAPCERGRDAGTYGAADDVSLRTQEAAGGLAVKVTDGFFLVGLSNVEADRTRNLQLLKERSWFDMPLV